MQFFFPTIKKGKRGFDVTWGITLSPTAGKIQDDNARLIELQTPISGVPTSIVFLV